MRGFTLADVAFLAPKGPVDVIEVSDDFNRSNASTLGGSWEASDGAWEIFSNEARHTGGTPTVVSNTVAMSSTNHWASIDIGLSNAGSASVCASMNGAESQFYMATFDETANQFILHRFNGSFTSLGTYNLGTSFAGVLTIRCAGSVVTLEQDGIVRVTGTYSTFAHNGVGMRANSGGSNNVFVDSFSAGITV